MDDPIAQAAILWWVKLQSGEGGAQTVAACHHWRQADPRHEHAWARLEKLSQAVREIPSGFAHSHLTSARMQATRASASPARQRRAVLKGLAIAGVIGGTGLAAAAWTPWQRLVADYSTRVGERKRVRLSDAVGLDLASDSAVASTRQDGQRHLTLWRGQIGIAVTEPSGSSDPLLVHAQGSRVRALNARFTVWRRPSGLRIDVYEGVVGIDAEGAGFRMLDAGTALYRKHDRWHEAAAHPSRAAWMDGLLVANGDRLAAVIAELARYHPGVLSVDPAAAGLIVSGVFPLDDPARAVDMLRQTLPITVTRWGPWWWQIAVSDPTRVSGKT